VTPAERNPLGRVSVQAMIDVNRRDGGALRLCA